MKKLTQSSYETVRVSGTRQTHILSRGDWGLSFTVPELAPELQKNRKRRFPVFDYCQASCATILPATNGQFFVLHRSPQ
jgi:hypothetical protein